MGGIDDLLGIAAGGLAAQSYALNIVGRNVSNVNTPGYARESTIMESQQYLGVNATGVARAVDTYAQGRFLSAQANGAAADSSDNALASVETLFNDTQGTGLSDAISGLFSSFSSLAADPSDTTTRASVLSAADTFATRVQSTGAALEQQKSDLLSQAQGIGTEINGLTSQLASINKQIGIGTANGSDTSQLQDQRDSLLSQLSQHTDVQVIAGANGQVTVRGEGTTLVDGSNAATLTVDTSASGALRVQSSLDGAAPVDVTQSVTAGDLGGIRQVRDTDIAATEQKLDQLTSDIGTAVNTQFAAGYGSDGVGGRPLFDFSAPPGTAYSITVDPNMAGHPDRVAAAGAPTADAGDSDNATALAELAGQTFATGGTQTAADAYGDLVGAVGQLKASSASASQLSASMTQQAQALSDSTSGVSIDEETIDLTKYQQAYEANSKLIQTADTLLSDLMTEIT